MIISCEECGKRYRIDPTKISKKDIKFKCKSCDHLIIAHKPPPLIATKKPDKTPFVSSPRESKPERAVEEKMPKPPKKKEVVPIKKSPEYTRPTKFRFGLTAKLFVMMITVSLVPLVMFWYITFNKTPDQIREDTKRNANQLSLGIAKHVDEWLDKNVRILKTLANLEDMISMDRILQEPLLATLHKVYPWIYLTCTIDLNGKNVARNDNKPLINYSDKQFFKEIVDGKKLAWQTLIDESTKKPALFLAVPILNGDKIVGVITNVMSLDDLSKHIVTWEGEDTGSAFLVDENGKVLAHKTEQYVRKQKDLRNHPLIVAYKNGQRGSVPFTNPEGKSILGHVRGTALGWILAIQQEEKEASYILGQLISYAYLLLGVTVVFVFIIAWFSGRALSRPIIKLTDAADRISVGELDVEIDTQRKDEIGDLAEAIALMQDSIRLSIERLRQRR